MSEQIPRVIECRECGRILESPLMEDAGKCCRLSVAIEIMKWVDKTMGSEDSALEKLEAACGVQMSGYVKTVMDKMIVGTFLSEFLGIDFELIIREDGEDLGD